MTEISRVALFGKLNALNYRAMEAATVSCKLAGNPYVEVVHWLVQVFQLENSDLHRIAKAFEIETGRLAADVGRAMERLPRRGRDQLDFSDDLLEAVKEGWLYGSLLFNETKVRSGHMLIGLLRSRQLRTQLFGISKEFEKIPVEALASRFATIVETSPETGMAIQATGDGAPGEHSGAIAPAQMGKQEALKKYCVDLTERARKGEIDPILGRDDEIRQIVDVLMRRRQNNPILTGEAGVGKTAVVEGFARKIVAGEVPPALRDVSLLMMDVGLLQAGASMKGEFENRLKSIIEEVQASPKPIILFIDEAHTLIGAGGAAGTGDAANLLKPALARGTLRTIAATTFAEYKKYFEKDPALTRRFQVIQVDEPSEPKAVLMMRGLASVMEKHHKVRLLDEALEAAVSLSARYVPARQLPDKAVSLLDTASARVAISQAAVPPDVEDTRQRILALETELEIAEREAGFGIAVGDRSETARTKLEEAKETLANLEARWEAEKGLVDRLIALRIELAAPKPSEADVEAGIEPAADAPAPVDRASLLAELNTVQEELTTLQGESPLIFSTVDAQAVAAVIADWTGIPVGRMVRNEIENVLNLPSILRKRVLGQDHAMELIAKRVETSRAKLDNPNKPVGVFMLCGPSGVGKTETALALGEALYGGEQNVITINMSEFQEAHTVSTLKGAPPGYVGYGEGGVLTEAVRRKPYSVVLLDEVEKAHSDVHEIFFQVFDKGVMEDGEGRLIDFKNTLILLTSNVGTQLIASMCKDPDLMPEPEALADALRKPLLEVFPPALLGRLVVAPYYPLSDALMGDIVRLQMNRITRRVEQNHKIPFIYDDAVVDLVVSRCTEMESGGRMIDAILTNTILPAVSGEILRRMLEGKPLSAIRIGAADGNFTYSFD